jgi:hypothetical protein
MNDGPINDEIYDEETIFKFKCFTLIHNTSHSILARFEMKMSTMKKTVCLSLSLLLLGYYSGTALAHHSFSMFDQSKKVTHTGIVEEVQWTNPHVWIFVNVTTENGSVERWGMEFTSKVHLVRRGFDPDMVKTGDEVEFTVSPYANGKPGGRFFTIKLANGSYYCDVGAASQQVCQSNN